MGIAHRQLDKGVHGYGFRVHVGCTAYEETCNSMKGTARFLSIHSGPLTKSAETRAFNLEPTTLRA